MKHYLSPKIQVVEVRNAFALCEGSGPTPTPSVPNTGLNKMTVQKLSVTWI